MIPGLPVAVVGSGAAELVIGLSVGLPGPGGFPVGCGPGGLGPLGFGPPGKPLGRGGRPEGRGRPVGRGRPEKGLEDGRIGRMERGVTRTRRTGRKTASGTASGYAADGACWEANLGSRGGDGGDEGGETKEEEDVELHFDLGLKKASSTLQGGEK